MRELAQRLKISEVSIYKRIIKLKQKDLIRRVGSDKGGHWEVIE